MPLLFLRFGVFACVVLAGSMQRAPAASGLFPKMPAAAHFYVVNCKNDSEDAKMSALALQGLVNQTSAEVYVVLKPLNREQLQVTSGNYTNLPASTGADPGLRALFEKYAPRVKKMFVYDPAAEWTWNLALMASAQQSGIPVTAAVKDRLVAEFHWNGTVEDFRTRWKDRASAYDWAVGQLLPKCNKQVVFALRYGKPLTDYIVASKGFVFWFDLKGSDAERTEMDKVFRAGNYTVGASLMGYDRDSANTTANHYGIGYVVSDLCCNESFWSSFPDKTYQQPPGRPVAAQPGKVYVAITWSDGDNLQFDQNSLYQLWRDPARGKIPVGTTLSPTLQELNSPLLDSYYARLTPNDELLAGPSGFQFIYGNDYSDQLFPLWCHLNQVWLAGAGFHTACLWHTAYPSSKYTTYAETSGLTGILYAADKAGIRLDGGVPAINEGHAIWSEDEIYTHLAKAVPDPKAPVFLAIRCIVAGLTKSEGDGKGYTKIQHQIEKLNAAYPGRYVFLLPKDLLATAQSYERH